MFNIRSDGAHVSSRFHRQLCHSRRLTTRPSVHIRLF